MTASDYEARCAETLARALADAPAYAGWRARDPGPATPVFARYRALPATTKADLRAHFPDGFVLRPRRAAPALAAGRLQLAHTSGSTDERVTLLWNQRWWNASERASWALNRDLAAIATGRHREAILTSPLSTGRLSEDAPLGMHERRLGRFLYLTERRSPRDWDHAHLDRIAVEIAGFRPVLLEANPSFIRPLAQHLAERGRRLAGPRAVVLTYEFPSRLCRRALAAVFDGPIVSSHGSTETGYVFMQCEAGSLHQNTAFCHVDFVPLRRALGRPGLGRILVTPFGNPWGAFLRFDIGDLVRLRRGVCPCGRTDGLTLAAVAGRVKDLTFAADGRPVTTDDLDRALDAVGTETRRVRGYRVRQTGPRRVEATLVCAAGLLPAVRAALSERYGAGVRIVARIAPHLPAETSGKYRLAGCEYDWDAGALFAGG